MNNGRVRKFVSGGVEHVLYWLSIVIILISAVLLIIQFWVIDYFNRQDLLTCGMKAMFGIPCPGCGGTRAVVSLLRGNLLDAIYYNAFAVYCCIVYGVFFVTQTLQRITKGKVHGMKYRHIYLWLAIAILVVQYVLKLVIPGYII